MRRMPAQKPSSSVGVVKAERGSRYVCFFSQYLRYLLLTFKTDAVNNTTVILNS